METGKLILHVLQAQIENLTIVNPMLAASIAGYLIRRLTKKMLHIVLLVILIVVAYEVFVATTGFGIPEELFAKLKSV